MNNGTRQQRQMFLGVAFDAITRTAALDALFDYPAGAPFVTLVTPNADHIVRIHASRGKVEQAYKDAWLCVNDSKVVGALARLAGIGLPPVPGADLVCDLFHDPRLARDTPILVVGGTASMVQTLRDRFGLTGITHYEPPMGLLSNALAYNDAVEAIACATARFVMIAVGSPQQELLAASARATGRATGIGMCIGASLEFLTGTRKRAPAAVRKLGLEWAHRLLSEPRRMWRRYLVTSPYVLVLFAWHIVSLLRIPAGRHPYRPLRLAIDFLAPAAAPQLKFGQAAVSLDAIGICVAVVAWFM